MKYELNEIKEKFIMAVRLDGQPSVTFKYNGKNYTILANQQYITFHENKTSSDVKIEYYSTFDELFTTKSIDDIVLVNIWNDVEDITSDALDYFEEYMKSLIDRKNRVNK